MKKQYVWLVLALLAGQLTACSSDGARQHPTARRASAPPPASSPPPTQAVASPEPLAPPAPGVAVLRPARRPGRRYWPQSGFQRSPRPARSYILAASGLPMPKADSAVSATASPTTPEAATALRDFMAAGLPRGQEFVLRPGRDTVLLGAQGTQLLVPADAWDLPANSGPVKLKLHEFYTVPDMLLAGLSTSADGQPLETGGMVHLAAATAAGQPAALRATAVLRLRLPTTQARPDMQLFWGQATETQINWRADTATRRYEFTFDPDLFSAATRPDPQTTALPGQVAGLRTALQWPLAADAGKLRRELQKATYPADTVARLLQASALSPRERALVYGYNLYAKKDKRPLARRMAEVEFVVSPAGRTQAVQVRPGDDARLAAPLLAVVRRWPPWQPAQAPTTDADGNLYPGTKIAAVGVVWVVLDEQGHVVTGPPTWEAEATEQLKRNTRAVQLLNAYQPQPGGSSRELLYNELSVKGLGWINCDRFIGSTQPLFTYAAPVPNEPVAQFTLVLRGTLALLRGQLNTITQQLLFGSVPRQTAATIVAIRWDKGQAWLATQPITLEPQAPKLHFTYRPVSLNELKQALAGLR